MLRNTKEKKRYTMTTAVSSNIASLPAQPTDKTRFVTEYNGRIVNFIKANLNFAAKLTDKCLINEGDNTVKKAAKVALSLFAAITLGALAAISYAFSSLKAWSWSPKAPQPAANTPPAEPAEGDSTQPL